MLTLETDENHFTVFFNLIVKFIKITISSFDNKNFSKQDMKNFSKSNILTASLILHTMIHILVRVDQEGNPAMPPIMCHP